MFYDTRKNDHGLPHNPFKAIVTPRPIGWITSMSAKGEINLAPYSFFNGITDKPPIVMFSSEGAKDSVAFAEEITSPILILHSRQDGRVSADQSLALGARLQALGKAFSLKIYDEKSHSLPARHFDSYDEIAAWFERHRSASPVSGR